MSCWRGAPAAQRIVTGTDVTKNVNKNNVTHAVLFEAINLVIHLGHTTELMPQACGLLGRFISIREANIRYLGLETMARLSIAQPDTMEALKKHQSTILFSLKDQDISIRRRALDLVYAMCDASTVRSQLRPPPPLPPAPPLHPYPQPPAPPLPPPAIASATRCDTRG